MRDRKLFPYIFVFFTGIFGVRKVQCYLSAQVTVLLEIKFYCLLAIIFPNNLDKKVWPQNIKFYHSLKPQPFQRQAVFRHKKKKKKKKKKIRKFYSYFFIEP